MNNKRKHIVIMGLLIKHMASVLFFCIILYALRVYLWACNLAFPYRNDHSNVLQQVDLTHNVFNTSVYGKEESFCKVKFEALLI